MLGETSQQILATLTFSHFPNPLTHSKAIFYQAWSRRIRKHFRLSKRLHWYNTAKRHWMISLPGTLWGCTGVPGRAGVRRNETADKLTSGSSTQQFIGPEPSLGVSRQNINVKIKCWVDNQHLVMWCTPCSTQRQARELILGPSPATKARFLSFNTRQSRVITGLLTGQNTLRRHLCVLGLGSNHTCRKCGTEVETSFHVLCECEALTPLKTYICGLLLFGPWGCYESKYRGRLELW